MRREIPGPKSYASYMRYVKNGNTDNPGFLERYWREQCGGRGARGGVGMRGGRGARGGVGMRGGRRRGRGTYG